LDGRDESFYQATEANSEAVHGGFTDSGHFTPLNDIVHDDFTQTEPEFYMNSEFVQNLFTVRERRVAEVLQRDGTTLSIVSTNVDILTNKMDEFLVFVEVEKPDIICVQEILPKNGTMEVDIDTAFKIDGYAMFYPEILKRGVLTYVKDEFTALEQVPDIDFEESVWVKVSLNEGRSLLVGNVYRSPNSSPENNDKLCQLINHASSYRGQLMVCGDFNYKEIDWEHMMVPHHPAHPASKFMNCVEDNLLIQHVKEYTRRREGQGSSTLDLIITRDEREMRNLEFGAPIGKSDHVVIKCNIDREDVHVDTAKKAKNFYRGDYDGIRREIKRVDWDMELDDCTVDEAWDRFEAHISRLTDLYIPDSKMSNKRKKKWINGETLSVVREKHKAHNRYRHNPTEENWNTFKECRNKVTSVTRQARADFEEQLMSGFKENPKPFWSYVNGQRSSRSGVAPLKNMNGDIMTEANDKADVLNEFFSSVFTEERLDDMPQMEEEMCESVLSSIEVDEARVRKELDGLKPGKSAGPDGMHPRVLIETKEEVVKPLTHIFCKSLREGTVPSRWKEAIVVPIFKKGQRHEPGNYRPVSLTSVCSKMLERIVREALLDHLDQNRLLTDAQHGFRAGRSCVTQLLSVTEEWTKWIDDGIPFDCAYLDYRKAFDSVPHVRLLHKLHCLGVRHNVHEWIRSFLTDRKQRVRVDSALSSWSTVTSGIPQGSVLGPTLFVCFINDLPGIAQSSSVMLFADDTKVYAPVQSVEKVDSLQTDLNSIMQWAQSWQLPFNTGKCKVLHFGRNNPGCSYSLGELEEIKDEDEEKDLGITFDQSLDFSRHIGQVCRKANGRIGIVRRTFLNVKPRTFAQLYKTFIRPVVEYGQVVAHPMFRKDEDKLEAVQRRATRLVNGMEDREYPERLKELRLPTLRYRRKRADVLQVYRIVHGVDDLPLTHFFEAAQRGTTRGHCHKIQKKHCRSKLRQESFSQRVVTHWNNLPEAVVTSEKVNTFKARLERWWRSDEEKFEYMPGWTLSTQPTQHSASRRFCGDGEVH